ncbi:MAG: FxsA family protein [Phycisphaerae bacterium]
MLFGLILLFVALPLAELALLIRIGRAIDVIPTIALVAVTGILGAALARHQGLRSLRRIQTDLHQGIMPAAEMLDGLMILLAGAVLVTPGVITDAIGFALLVPPIRTFVRKRLADHFKASMTVMHQHPDWTRPPEDGFIDVQVRAVEKDDQEAQ